MGNTWKSFRFVDDKLQLSLLKLLEEVNFGHSIAPDKTIHYSSDDYLVVDTIIIQVFETVVGDAWYRADIADETKAERYRRFKRYTGTPFVEATHSGETWFVQPGFHKLYRHKTAPTRVCFILKAEDLNPTEVTDQIGLQPTYSCFKGEPFSRPYSGQNKKFARRSSLQGWWEMCSIPEISSNDVQLHLDWLFDKFEPVSSKIPGLKAKWTDIDSAFSLLQITIVKPSFVPPWVSISRSDLSKMGEIADRLDIDFMDDDFK